MAKLSLWLLTLAKDKPFEFLDHAIRCGDSLVGIHNLDQLRKFNLDGKGTKSCSCKASIKDDDEAIALRLKITEMQANTVEDVEAQDRMLREANEKIDRLKFAADLLIVCRVRARLRCRASEPPGTMRRSRSPCISRKRSAETFAGKRPEGARGQVTFHWPLEFPEVMVKRGGFDAFVGNPPFMGGKTHQQHTLGTAYRDYLVDTAFPGKQGNADLCAYFFLRAATCSVRQGGFGLLATNTICPRRHS